MLLFLRWHAVLCRAKVTGGRYSLPSGPGFVCNIDHDDVADGMRMRMMMRVVMRLRMRMRKRTVMGLWRRVRLMMRM
jgi:hypothetical protein